MNLTSPPDADLLAFLKQVLRDKGIQVSENLESMMVNDLVSRFDHMLALNDGNREKTKQEFRNTFLGITEPKITLEALQGAVAVPALGAVVKEFYPAYAARSDDDVGHAYLAKFPKDRAFLRRPIEEFRAKLRSSVR